MQVNTVCLFLCFSPYITCYICLSSSPFGFFFCTTHAHTHTKMCTAEPCQAPLAHRGPRGDDCQFAVSRSPGAGGLKKRKNLTIFNGRQVKSPRWERKGRFTLHFFFCTRSGKLPQLASTRIKIPSTLPLPPFLPNHLGASLSKTII